MLFRSYYANGMLWPASLASRAFPLPDITSIGIIFMATFQALHFIKPLLIICARYLRSPIILLSISVYESSFRASHNFLLLFSKTLKNHYRCIFQTAACSILFSLHFRPFYSQLNQMLLFPAFFPVLFVTHSFKNSSEDRIHVKSRCSE